MAGQAGCASRSRTTDINLLNFGYYSDEWAVAVEPLHEDRPGRNGAEIGTSFARRLLSDHVVPGKVGLVPCAWGGSNLRRWTRRLEPARTEPADAYADDPHQILPNPGGPGDLYERAWRRARLALSSHPHAVLRGVLWHQGTGDGRQLVDATSYASRLRQFIADLRADFNISALPIVLGEQGEWVGNNSLVPIPYVDEIRQQTEEVVNTVPHCGLASARGLSHKGD
eukprot:SAG31_NODE_4585_length_3116_cov_5.020882_3_plen_225_part_01